MIGARLGRLLDTLRAAGAALALTGCTITSEAFSPPSARATVEIGAAPVLGPAEAAVTLVEFADFECPYCGEEEPVLKQVLTAYEGRVRLVYKHYPLSFHEHAALAAEASLAAHAEGKFWAYHDALYADQSALARGDLESRAAALGLDMMAFGAALDQGTHAAAVAADVAQGDALGIPGTPAFFVNGRMGAGAVPYEAWVAILDEEIEAAGR